MTDIYAFTERDVEYPGYVTISENGKDITVAVRTRNFHNSSVVHMTREELLELARVITLHLTVR